MKADLHLHTTASDGLLEPREIVALAAKVGLDVIAITDHDTINGIAPALSAAESFPSLTVVPGVELSTDVPHGEIHVLGYFIDYNSENLAASLRELRDSRQGRALKMIVKLRDLGMEIQWQRVEELAQGGSIGRPHLAQALLEAGHVVSLKEAFDKYIGRDGPAYAEREKMLPSEAVSLITSARGLPVLAHPADIDDLDKILSELQRAGLVGIEVYYGKYTPDVIDRLTKFAGQYGLVTTGGSDYHAFGDGVETMIGGAQPPLQSVKQLISLADKRSLELTKGIDIKLAD